MKARVYIAQCVFFSLFFLYLGADNRIILFLKHVPSNVVSDVEQEAKSQSLATKIAKMDEKTPASISKKIVKNSLRTNVLPALSGFFAIYGGYIDISDIDGLISFPLRHASPKIYIAVTAHINLVNIKGNTFSHREYKSDEPVTLYVCELKKDKKKLDYWEVKESPIPTDRKVNPLTLVILTNPKNIYIPQGEFLAIDKPHLNLPDVYVTGRLGNEDNLLQNLDIRRFFEPISTEEKKINDVAIQTMITNL